MLVVHHLLVETTCNILLWWSLPCFSGGDDGSGSDVTITCIIVVWCGGSLDNLVLIMLGIGGIVFIAVHWCNDVRSVVVCDCCVKHWTY